jgi:diguanylate cyclase (GGDEF)-like protein/PAS domain S-box-containing protein
MNDFARLSKQALCERLDELLAQGAPISGSTAQHLLHELHVHQVELEMQNHDLREAHLSLEAAYARYADLYNQAPVGYLTLDHKGRILEVNPKAAALLGDLPRKQLIGKPLAVWLSPQQSAVFFGYLRRLLEARPLSVQPERIELTMLRSEMGPREVLLEGVAIEEEARDGRTVGLQCRSVIIDITERKKAEQALTAQRALLEATIDSAVDPIMVIDPDYRILLANRAAGHLIPGSSEDGSSVPCYSMLHHENQPCGDRPDHPCPVERVKHSGKPIVVVHKHYDTEGNERIVEVAAAPVWDAEGKLYAIVEHAHDITERKRYESLFREERERLRHLAHHDPLTGLPNRLLFQDRLAQALVKAHRTDTQLAVLFLDVDRFKGINDTLGHMVGDQVLKAIAQRLRKCMREEDTVARLGGDEFTILLEGLEHPEAAAKVAWKVLEGLRRPFTIGSHEFHIEASIGISLYPDNGPDLDSLIKHADAAMYLAKEQGRGNYQFFSEALNERTRRQLALETALRRALKRGELSVYYQPQVALASGRIVAVEALVRWTNAELGSVPPGDFISVAEESGLIVTLGEWVLRSACAQLRRWHEAGCTSLRVAVNLSARQFRQRDLIERIHSVLIDTGISPRHLELELTESVLLAGTEEAIGVMEQLRALGVHLSLDDFGTGYSSLAYLKRFPLDRLKVAQEFVHDIPADPHDTAIARAVVALAKSLELEVVAEGVESLEQCELFRALGCDYVQGYLLGRPLPAEDIETLLVGGGHVTIAELCAAGSQRK